MDPELQRLRRSLRRTQLGAALGVLALGLLAASGPKSIVRAEQFELVDARGQVVGTWSAGSAGPRLELDDARVVLQADGAGGRLELRDAQGATLRLDGGFEAAAPSAPAPPPVTLGPGGVEFTLAEGTTYTSVEIVCPSGFRERASVLGGVARFAEVPAQSCKAVFKGGAPAKVTVSGGDRLSCHLEGAVLLCR